MISGLRTIHQHIIEHTGYYNYSLTRKLQAGTLSDFQAIPSSWNAVKLWSDCSRFLKGRSSKAASFEHGFLLSLDNSGESIIVLDHSRSRLRWSEILGG